MTYALETNEVGKRYGRHWALQDCTLHVPAGSVAGLVGLNGAGKTTLMHLMTGLIAPDAGSIQILGETPSQKSTSLLSRVGFVAQEHPLYHHFKVRDMLTLGSKLNANWDNELARDLLARLKIPLTSGVGKLSGGQQAQAALIMALAKGPEVLLLDEPFANVDPLARREFMKILLETVATRELSVLLSSHIVADLDQFCDYLIILSPGHVQIAANIEDLISSHKLLIVPREDFAAVSSIYTVLQSSHTERQSYLLVHMKSGNVDNPSWQVQSVPLEEIVLAYLTLSDKAPQEPASSKQEVLQ